jgi:hypothetical protein
LGWTELAAANGVGALATLGVDLEPQVVSEPVERGGRGLEYGDMRHVRDSLRTERAFPLALVSGLTLVAALVEGYHPLAEDGGLYVAGVKRLLNPALYPKYAVFVLEPMRHSIFAPMVAAVVWLSHLSLPWVLLVLHLASIWLTLFAAWMLAERCWIECKARTGAVTLLACWLSLPVAGTALLLMDPYLTARSFSTPAMVLALVGALDWSEPDWYEQGAKAARRRGGCLWAASLLLAAVIHPLMAVYALSATLMLICARLPRSSARLWGTLSLIACALALAACLQAVARPESAMYMRVALTRGYWFVAQWRWFELLGLAAPLVILTWFTRHNPTSTCLAPTPEQHARQALTRMAVAIGVTAWLVASLFARAGAATHLVARLQPLRGFQIVYLILVLMLGARLGSRLLQQSVWRWAMAILLLGGTMFCAQGASFPHSNHLELPGVAPRNQWVQVFLWVRENTPTDALFALDADYINLRGEDAQCFRAIAERSALADYSKDGGEASIAPELTAEWAQEQAAQQRLNAPETTDDERLAALAPLGVTWVILQDETATGFDCPYRNAAGKVCRLR